MKYEIEWPPWSELVNKRFVSLIHNQDRYLILWGGRGSSKSVFTAKKLVYRCLNEPYFRCILFRNVFDTIRDSQWQTIKDIVEEMGLSPLFKFTKSPLEIVAANGNKFIAKGGDRTSKIKSTKDPTCVWYEEDIPEEDSFYNITGTIRSMKADYLQEIFTLNPELDEHFEENWFWQMFFEDHPGESSFNDVTHVDVKGEIIDLTYTCHHSTHWDNMFLPKETRAMYENYKNTNTYKYTTQTLGLWSMREIGGRFWKSFDISLHTGNHDMDLSLPLHISFDENVRPYPALSIWQIDGVKVRQIHEICLEPPRNKQPEVVKEFVKWCRVMEWNNKVYLYGDASSDKEDTKLEKGQNYWTMMRNGLDPHFPVQIRKPGKNPPVALSAEFINEVYSGNISGMSISIDSKCKKSIYDYQFAEEAADGSMMKKKKLGIELIGHLSDTKRYFIIEAFGREFRKYQKPISSNRKRFTVGKPRKGAY